MKIIVAIDSFKDCISSDEANQAVKEVLLQIFPDASVISLPVSDGGEGWIDAFMHSCGGNLKACVAHDPLMRKCSASYLKINNTAVIESASVIGIQLLAKDERNPMIASSYGLGELIAKAVLDGCDEVIVGLGGSATSDCGIGMLNAIDKAMNSLTEKQRESLPQHVDFKIATDVTNPLCGIDGAAQVFATQKGADTLMVDILERRARLFAHNNAQKMGYDCSTNPGAGAAGGLGYAFMQFLDAQVCPGAEMLLNKLNFDDLLNNADLVITGEGRADAQTLMGKLPLRIMKRAKKQGIKTFLIAGQTDNIHILENAGFNKVICINPPHTPIHQAMQKSIAINNLKSAISSVFII